jgi:hypothetical protein
MSEEKQHIIDVQNRYVLLPIYHQKTRKMTMFFLLKTRYHYTA